MPFERNKASNYSAHFFLPILFGVCAGIIIVIGGSLVTIAVMLSVVIVPTNHVFRNFFNRLGFVFIFGYYIYHPYSTCVVLIISTTIITSLILIMSILMGDCCYSCYFQYEC